MGEKLQMEHTVLVVAQAPAYYIIAIVDCHALLLYSIMYFTDSSRMCA
jgi:hypothetical protein